MNKILKFEKFNFLKRKESSPEEDQLRDKYMDFTTPRGVTPLPDDHEDKEDNELEEEDGAIKVPLTRANDFEYMVGGKSWKQLQKNRKMGKEPFEK